jgi:hypothetical protein
MERLQDGIFPVRDGRHFDHVALIAEIISGGFAERTLWLAQVGQDFSFDDDFGVRGNIDVRRLALGQGQRTAEETAGDGNLVLGRRADDGSEQKNRMNAEADRDVERAIVFFGFRDKPRYRRIGQMDTEAPRAFYLEPM